MPHQLKRFGSHLVIALPESEGWRSIDQAILEALKDTLKSTGIEIQQLHSG